MSLVSQQAQYVLYRLAEHPRATPGTSSLSPVADAREDAVQGKAGHRADNRLLSQKTGSSKYCSFSTKSSPIFLRDSLHPADSLRLPWLSVTLFGGSDGINQGRVADLGMLDAAMVGAGAKNHASWEFSSPFASPNDYDAIARHSLSPSSLHACLSIIIACLLLPAVCRHLCDCVKHVPLDAIYTSAPARASLASPSVCVAVESAPPDVAAAPACGHPAAASRTPLRVGSHPPRV
jgi:hypothetical protein